MLYNRLSYFTTPQRGQETQRPLPLREISLLNKNYLNDAVEGGLESCISIYQLAAKNCIMDKDIKREFDRSAVCRTGYMTHNRTWL